MQRADGYAGQLGQAPHSQVLLHANRLCGMTPREGQAPAPGNARVADRDRPPPRRRRQQIPSLRKWTKR
jgi:hypothetical protein